MEPDLVQPVNLDTNPPVTNPVSIDTNAPGAVQPSAPVADVRSKKVSYSMGELLGKSQQEIYSSIMQGQEGQLREQASAALDVKNEAARQDYLINIAKQNNLTFTPDQLDQLRKKPSDPNSVFEDGYAAKVLGNIFSTSAVMDETNLPTAMSAAPTVVSSDMDKAKDHLSNYEYARRKNEDLTQTYENQGWLPWVSDQAKQAIPFFSYLKLHQWFSEQGTFENFLPGQNLEQQTRELLRLPGPEFRTRLDDILSRLDPTMAKQYSDAVLGMSSTDVGLANLNTAIDLSVLPLAKGIDAGLKAVIGTRTAMKDVIKEVAQSSAPNTATIAEGLGDTSTAAVLRATDKITADMQGTETRAANSPNINTMNDPIRMAKEALPSGLITDTANIAANPGPLSRELLNRILQDQDVASKGIVSVIAETAKVQKISIEEATPIVMNRIKEEVKSQNPGIKNAIADIGNPVWNNISNTYNFPIKLFNWTAEQFSTEAAAKRFATEHGIQEYGIEGKAGARYYIPEAAVKRGWETKSRLGEVRSTPEGVRVFTDDGIEVQTSLKPAPGMIPIEVGEKGVVKFHPTLRTDEEITKATIEQKGLGYHLQIWKSLNEGQDIIKDLMVNLESTKSIASQDGVGAWFNSIFPVGYMRTSDATLSPFEVLQRKTATYSISNYQKLLQGEVKYIQDVARGRVRVDPVTGEDRNGIVSYISTLSPITNYQAKNRWEDFKRALAAAPGIKDPVTGRNGYLLANPYEINEFWREKFKRSASFEEIRAWLAFKRLYEDDRVFRSVREYSFKARLGAEQHQITFIDKTGEKIQSGFFDATQHKSLPGGDYPIMIADGGTPRVKLTSKLGNEYKELNKKVDTGEYVVSEIYAPENRPLKSVPGVGYNYIRYIVAPAANRETKPLSWEQVNRLNGTHFNYDFSHSIKEANVLETRAGNTTIHSYEGDKTFMFVNGNAQGRQIVNVLNKVKEHLRGQDEIAARDVFENGLKGEQGPAMEWKDFLSRTRSKKDEFGNTIPAQININEPYKVVPKGRNILDMDDSLSRRYGNYNDQGEFQSTFQDRTKSGSLSRQYQVGYTQERDAEDMMSLRNIGSKNNPIYKYEPAKMVDPIVTMNRALNQITRSTVMDDMRISAIEGWLREAEGLLKKPNDDISAVRSASWYYFKNADSRDAFKAGADPTVVANLLSNRFKIQQFLGQPSKYDLFMHDTSQKLADWMYDTMGPKGEMVPTWLFTKTTSPVSMLRAMAYHAKLGLFAVPQLLTQSQTYFTIAALAPRSAPAGAYAAMLTQWSKFATNPEFIDTLDHWATKMSLPGFHGFKPGEFKEALTELNNRGFANVGGEYGTLDTQLRTNYFRGLVGDVLDAGQSFFKMAEQNVRYGAWFTAYKEYKAANPSKISLTRTDWDKILGRADDMSGNMSRASASILQSGPLSLTGQFLTYQAHVAELYWGKRIGDTLAERNLARFRMNLIYGSMFGIGGAAGVAGFPITQAIRQYAQENGYVVGDNWYSSMFHEGLPAAGLAWLTSPDGSPQKGNWYNIQDKFGIGGLTFFTDAMRSDQKWYSWLGGAATSIAGNTWTNSKALRTSSWDLIHGSMMTGREEDEAFPMKMEDWLDMFNEASEFNQVRKTATAIATGRWLSKNEGYQGEVSKANAIFMGLTGLNMTQAADNYIVSQNIKDHQEKQKEALNEYVKEIHRSIIDANNNDWPSFKQHVTRAYGYLKRENYPIEDYPKAAAIAGKDWEGRISSIREEFYTKNVPAGKEETYGSAWERFLKTQEK